MQASPSAHSVPTGPAHLVFTALWLDFLFLLHILGRVIFFSGKKTVLGLTGERNPPVSQAPEGQRTRMSGCEDTVLPQLCGLLTSPDRLSWEPEGKSGPRTNMNQDCHLLQKWFSLDLRGGRFTLSFSVSCGSRMQSFCPVLLGPRYVHGLLSDR